MEDKATQSWIHNRVPDAEPRNRYAYDVSRREYIGATALGLIVVAVLTLLTLAAVRYWEMSRVVEAVR
jgi:hypothetical protein